MTTTTTRVAGDRPGFETPPSQQELFIVQVARDMDLSPSNARRILMGYPPLQPEPQPEPKPEPEPVETEPVETEDENEEDFDLTYAEARPLAVAMCRRALAEYQQTREAYQKAQALYSESEAGKDGRKTSQNDEWERWLTHLDYFAEQAGERLALCVLMALGRVKNEQGVDKLERGWAPVAFDFGRTLVVVHPTDIDNPCPVLTLVESGGFDSKDFGVGAGDDVLEEVSHADQA